MKQFVKYASMAVVLIINAVISRCIATDKVAVQLDLYKNKPLQFLQDKFNNGDKNQKIMAGYELGRIYFLNGKYKEAAQVFEATSKLIQADLNNEVKYRLYVNCGISFSKLSEYSFAIHYLTQSKLYLDSKGNPDEYAVLCKDIGETYYNWAKLDSAAIYLRRSDVLFQSTKNEIHLPEVYNMLGAIAHSFHKSDISISYYKKAQTIAERYHQNKERINAIINLGIEYLKGKHFDLAAQSLNEALRLSRLHQYKKGEIFAMNQIATLFAQKNDNSTALAFIKKSDSIAASLPEIDLKILITSNSATVYKLMKQFDKAADLLIGILNLQKTNALNTATTELALAEIYIQINKLDLSMKYLESCKKRFEETDDKEFLSNIEFQKAEILIKQKKTVEAEELLLDLASTINREKSNKNLETLMGIYLRLSELYKSKNNTEKAINYYKAYHSIWAEDMERSYNFELAKIQNESDIYKLSNDNSFLSLQNNAKSAEIDFQKKKEIFFICLSIMGFIVFFSLLKLYVDKSRLNTELAKRNIELSKHIPFQEEKDTLSGIEADDFGKSKEIIEDLIALFENQHVYLNSEISLNDVANQLKTNRTYLSKAIHEILQTNFNTLVNKYRIEEARKMLADPYQKQSIEGISRTVGFNSKSTFNTAFKMLTGITPSMLREEVLKEFNSKSA